MGRTGRLPLLLAITVFAGAIGSVIGQDCVRYGGISKCPATQPALVYKEEVNRQTSSLCCIPGTKMYEGQKKWSDDCRNTQCIPGANSDNVCDSLGKRYIDGVQLEYEAIATEPCETSSGGEGLAGLCCPKNSLEGMLATTLGAEPNEFPHIVKLQLPSHCGGTIYNKRFILTAAHCIVNKKTHKVNDASNMKVVLGSNIGNSKENVIKVKRAIPHYDYSRLENHKELEEKHPRTFNDVALLELEEDITFGPNVKALEMAPVGFKAEDYADKAVIAGWGTTDTLAVSENLQKANFIIRPDEKCFGYNTPHGEMKGMEDQLLCAGGILEDKWSPTAGGGDSGGPAICRGSDGKIVLCGITSFGGSDEDCAAYKNETSCLPSVFAEVGNANFQKWIKKEAKGQDRKTFYKPYLYGKPVSKEDYPHQVHLTSSGNGKSCGGTLLAPDIVITAAQCVLVDNGSPVSVKVTSGIDDLNDSGKTHWATKILKLGGFKMTGDPVDIAAQGNRVLLTDNYYKNDLALVKLDSEADIDSSQIPEIFSGSPETGVELAFPRGDRWTHMGARDFKFLDQQQCQRRMNRMSNAGLDIKVDSNLLCGVEKYSGGSTCDRELGGGVLCKGEDGKDQLCGVQVFRMCSLSIPNGFMNLRLYKKWIEKNMAKL